MRLYAVVTVLIMAACVSIAAAEDIPTIAQQPANTWVKRSPLPGGPPSPRLGYESSMGYIPGAGKLVRWGGHDPGGGGPQLSETWTFDLNAGTWQFLTPNNNPPGNCCCRENVTDPTTGKFYRFSHPAFGHGWMWDRARWLREDSVWVFDPARNTWTNMRPGKEPHLNVGKPAFYDPNHNVIWVYDTKLRAYDPHTNTWHIVSENAKVTGSEDRPIGKRTYAGMALHPRLNKIVLFGDHYQSDPRTLVYDIAKDEWVDMKPKIHPPGEKSCPTMVYDSANNIMICVMLGGRTDTKNEAERHLETWTYQLETNTWTKMDVAGGPDYFGSRDRLMVYIPELNIVALESRGKEQQIWTYRYRQAPPRHSPPVEMSRAEVVTDEGGKATISWVGLADDPKREAGFRVYRAEGEQPWKTVFEPIAEVDGSKRDYTDRNLKPSTVYYYRVTGFSGKEEGPPTPVVRTQPRVIVDSRVDVLATNKVVYSWAKSSEPDVVGYVVERAVVVPVSVAQKVKTVQQYVGNAPLGAMAEKAIIGNFVRLTDKPIAATAFTDNVDLTKKAQPDGKYWQALFSAREKGAPATRPEDDRNFDMTQPGCPYAIYAYRVRAVNRAGVESGPSPYQLTVPNEPEQVFTKEDGKDAIVRWQASPHAGVTGYLLLRVDGQYAKTTVLTEQPIKETTFTDKTADGKAHRYYVVVVDALGQHGLPSHGAWAFRQWSQIYTQFYAKDGWHQ